MFFRFQRQAIHTQDVVNLCNEFHFDYNVKVNGDSFFTYANVNDINSHSICESGQYTHPDEVVFLEFFEDDNSLYEDPDFCCYDTMANFNSFDSNSDYFSLNDIVEDYLKLMQKMLHYQFNIPYKSSILLIKSLGKTPLFSRDSWNHLSTNDEEVSERPADILFQLTNLIYEYRDNWTWNGFLHCNWLFLRLIDNSPLYYHFILTHI